MSKKKKPTKTSAADGIILGQVVPTAPKDTPEGCKVIEWQGGFLVIPKGLTFSPDSMQIVQILHHEAHLILKSNMDDETFDKLFEPIAKALPQEGTITFDVVMALLLFSAGSTLAIAAKKQEEALARQVESN